MSLAEGMKYDAGWDYVVKLTYSTTSRGGTYLISQVEKIKVVKYGYKSELVFEHKNSGDDPSWVGSSQNYQEIRIPLRVLGIQGPTKLAFLFIEGGRSVFTKVENCEFIKAALE